VFEKQIIIKRHDDLAQADALKKKIDKIMTVTGRTSWLP
jgi:hypothetical protein